MRLDLSLIRSALGLTGALLLTSCNYAIERDWESLWKLGNGEYNRMSAYTDKQADATIHATSAANPGVWTRFYFEGTWSESSDFFRFKFACKQGPCDGDDFEMLCQIIEEDPDKTYKLDCDANNKWKSYPFSWQEVL